MTDHFITLVNTIYASLTENLALAKKEKISEKDLKKKKIHLYSWHLLHWFIRQKYKGKILQFRVEFLKS